MYKILAILLMLSFHWVQGQSVAQDEEAIRQSRKASNEAIARKDVEDISKTWMDDFVLIRGNGTMTSGKDSVKESWKKVFASAPETSFERNPSEVIISARDPSIAWESGTWKGINAYSKGGRYSAMWKKQNGIWKLQAELFVALLK